MAATGRRHAWERCRAMAYGPSELNHQAKSRPDYGGDGLLTVGTKDHVQTKRWVANPLCRAPDLSHRPEADGRWPRVVTGENGTLELRRLTVLRAGTGLPYLARHPSQPGSAAGALVAAVCTGP